jgi:glycosyltransferase involved in cell wall biosynthesis
MGYLERIVPLVQLSVHNYFVASNTFWKTANPVKVRKYWMATGIRPGYDQSTSIVTESTMRIVYGLTTLGLGGAERQALAVAEAMERRGHGVVLLVLGPRLEREWPTELPVVRLGMRKNPISLLYGFCRARRFLRDYHPDLLHSHCAHSNLFARLLRRWVANVRVISTVHNVYEGPWPRMLAYRLTDRWADRTVFVSQAAAARYEKILAASLEKMCVLTNGIDTEAFAPDRLRRAAMRGVMGVTSEFVWLSAGRLTAAKDLPNLLRGFAQAEQANAEARLWIAGEGAAEFALRLKTLAAELGIDKKVRWLGLRRDLDTLMDAADGFVLASAWEGMPLVLGEAMALEKPVVATDVGGVCELVGEAGRVVVAKDPAALASALIATMQLSADERKMLGKQARRRIEERFSMATRVEAWERLYREVLGQGA